MPKPRQRAAAPAPPVLGAVSRRLRAGVQPGRRFGAGAAMLLVSGVMTAVAVYISLTMGPAAPKAAPSSPARDYNYAAGDVIPRRRRLPNGSFEDPIMPGWNDSEPLPFVDLYRDLEPCEGGYHCARRNPRNHMAVRDNGAADFCDFDVLNPGELTFEKFEKECVPVSVSAAERL